MDLLLMEEFHVSPSFVVWFTDRLGLGASVKFHGAWHSLCDQDGETDLMLRVQSGDERVAVLIENKITAPEQPEQDKRYHVRGERARQAGHCERFTTAICAPQMYLSGLADTSAYEHRVPYEAIRDWYKDQLGERAAWRCQVMGEAIEQGRRGYVMKVHANKTLFHGDYWIHVQSHYPTLVMARPGKKGPKSDWMMLRAPDLTSGSVLIHKNDQGCVDLEFARTRATDLAKRRQAHWPTALRVVQRGNSAALSILVPRCNMDISLNDQLDSVDAALRVAEELAAIMKVP